LDYFSNDLAYLELYGDRWGASAGAASRLVRLAVFPLIRGRRGRHEFAKNLDRHATRAAVGPAK
jgi:hypothetical protein